jgi:hypothetical protein
LGTSATVANAFKPTGPADQAAAQSSIWDFGLTDNQSLFVFGPESALRRFALGVVEHRFFAPCILVHILVNTIIILLSESSLRSSPHFPSFQKFVDISEIYFCVLYGAELCLKILARGFLWCGPHSYILDRWNALDFVVWILS